jgi:hypothetical protein
MRNILSFITLVASTMMLLGQNPWPSNTSASISLSCTNGFNLVTCPIGNGNNYATNRFLSPVPNMTVWKYNQSTSNYWVLTNLTATTWSGETGMTLEPGVGFWLHMPTNAVITFAGDVVQGTNSMSTGTAYTPRGVMVPVAGKIMTDLGFPATNGDKVYLYNTGGTYTCYSKTPTGWSPSEPIIAVGQGFFLDTVTNKTWSVVYDANAEVPKTQRSEGSDDDYVSP